MSQPSSFPTDEPRIIDEPVTWLETNRLGILVTIGLVVLASVAGVWLWQGRQARVMEAAALFVKATEVVAWQKIADDFAGTPSAPLALVRLAQASREKSEWDAALAQLDRFIREYPPHPFFPAVQLSRAQTLELAGRVDEAMQSYEAIHSAKPTHPMDGAAVLGLARLHKAKGNVTAARSVLSDFLATDRASVFTSEISQELKSLPEPSVAPSTP